MKIRKKFLELTKQTYPHGTESELENLLPEGCIKDDFGNYYIIVGENTSVMFTCHLDTYGKEKKNIKHVIKNNFIMTDGQSILGADDKAGMVVLLYMIQEKVPGLYYFFIGEEVGCIGSKKVADFVESGFYDIPELKNITKVISFDRKGTTSIITEQAFSECCSTEFATELATRLNNVRNGLNMRLDDTGFSTDSAQFMSCVPECTNISVGYYDEHTVSERLDIQYLYRLCHAVTEIDWETLPVVRDPQKIWYIPKKSTLSRYGLDDWDAPFDNSTSIYSPNTREQFADGFDTKYYTFIKDPADGKRKMAYISKSWVFHEEFTIFQSLRKQGLNYKEIKWDGTTCWGYEHGYKVPEYLGGRQDMAIHLDNFGYIPSQHLIFESDLRNKRADFDRGWSNNYSY